MAKREPHGTHRVSKPYPIVNEVWVTDGSMGFELPEAAYRSKGYAPPVETLPWGTSTPDGGGFIPTASPTAP